MPDTALPRTPAGAESLPVSRRAGLWLAAALATIWVIFLAVITIRTANPPVINRMQIEAADFIFVGRWENRADGRFLVERELKRGQLAGPVTVLGLPARGLPAGEEWVIPVSKTGTAYSVTNGVFTTRPPQGVPENNAAVWKIQVPPQCYPATDDVLRQIADALPAKARPQKSSVPIRRG